MAITPDSNSPIEIPGPWQHRYVAANGARFHVAESTPRDADDPPLVVLLHGFPEFWWSWRDQLPALAGAGYRAVAMDLRGYGGSDKTPRGYDPVTLAQDVAGVIKALGERTAIVVGHGWGGYVGWAVAALHPREVSALCVVSAPHPRVMLRNLRPGNRVGALAHVLAMQVPMLPERKLANPKSGYIRSHLQDWSGPDSSFPDTDTVATYQAALTIWPAPHCALEYHRWLFRSRLRADGRHFNHLMDRSVSQPVFSIHGDQDPALPAGTDRRTEQLVTGDFRRRPMAGAGHFPHEEQPQVFNDVLLSWLRDLPRTR